MGTDLIPLGEAAELLDVTERHVRHLVREGYITPALEVGSRKEMMFHLDEVLALKKARSKKLDLASVAGTAAQAHALSQSLAKRIEELYEHLGLKNSVLSTEPEHVMALHLKALADLESNFSNVDPAEVLEWAKALQAIDEPYLKLVSEATAAEHPWEAYYKLAEKIVLEVPKGSLQYPPMAHAFGFLLAARNNLRTVAYFYMRLNQGKRVADQVFPEDDIDHEIMSHIQH